MFHLSDQCDQIGRFIGICATFQSLMQQLICPNLPHSLAIFVKVSKSLFLLVKSFLGNFYRHLAFFTGQTDHHQLQQQQSRLISLSKEF